MDQHLLNTFPQIARHFKRSDRVDTGPLDNKDGGIGCRQGVPWLESLFLFHAAASNSHLYLIFPFPFSLPCWPGLTVSNRAKHTLMLQITEMWMTAVNVLAKSVEL